MIDTSLFAGDGVLQQILDEVNTLMTECSKFVRMELAPTTYSHVKGYREQADKFLDDLTQKIHEISLARHLKQRELRKTAADMLPDAFEMYGRNRWYAENTFDGEPVVRDLKLVLESLDTCIETLTSYRWNIRDNKSQVTNMFEKTQ